ncbi:MAG: 5'/3'-nucleotidase SurE [Actinobacteria bacterium]|nr:5'/3'-nucleotidase SurE [Actinomycetota bacterium]
MQHRRFAAWVLSLGIAMGATACSSSGTSASKSTGTTTVHTTAPKPASGPAPLVVVVTNDDGIAAPGIDELARALAEVPGVTVDVVAPATNQSGKGDNITPGTVKHQAAKTKSGIEGVAVDGTPADSVIVAIKDLKLKPDLVASGINLGQNVGPLTAISGTVGAALTGARNGVPGVAGSAGLTDPDYAAAAKYVVAWVVKNRAALAAHRMPTDGIVNFNVPGCTAGSIRGIVEVPTAKVIPTGANPFATDCSTPRSAAAPTDDVDALILGFASQSTVAIATTRN